MQLKAAILPKHLETQLLPAYMISGDEPQQLDDAGDAIRAAARKAGCGERLVFRLQPGFDWAQFTANAGSVPMFTERRIVELHCNNLPAEADCKQLLQFLQSQALAADDVLLLRCPRIRKHGAQRRLLEAMAEKGAVIQVWPLSPPETEDWLRHRLQRHNLKLSTESLQILLLRVEGNLIAAAQEVEKIRLFADAEGHIDESALRRAVANNARYDGFRLAEKALAGDAPACVRIIAAMRSETSPPLAPLAAITREIRTLIELAQAKRLGTSTDEAMRAQKVWPQRQWSLKKALGRHPQYSLQQMLRRAARVDQAVKGDHSLMAWEELERLCLSLAGTRLKL